MFAEMKFIHIFALKMGGFSNKDVIKQVNICRKTVFNMEKVQSTLCNPIPGRRHSVRTKRVIQIVRKRV